MNPIIEAMARKIHKADEAMFDSSTWERRKEQARAALIALRDHEDTPPAAVAWIVKMMEE